MKAVILAGGLGTRLSEETGLIPKPMVKIGEHPILWHILKMYSQAGINEFVICLGYKGYVVKEYFANYFLHSSDVTIDLKKNTLEFHQSNADPWIVTLVDTGAETMTGGRLARARKYIGAETFCMTYGDGVSDIDIQTLISFHQQQKRLATISAVVQPGRFGTLELDNDRVSRFIEKPKVGSYINGGFFVLEPETLDLISGDDTVWEEDPLEHLSAQKELGCFLHDGFWQCMDTLRDKRQLDSMWQESKAPWRTWK